MRKRQKEGEEEDRTKEEEGASRQIRYVRVGGGRRNGTKEEEETQTDPFCEGRRRKTNRRRKRDPFFRKEGVAFFINFKDPIFKLVIAHYYELHFKCLI